MCVIENGVTTSDSSFYQKHNGTLNCHIITTETVLSPDEDNANRYCSFLCFNNGIEHCTCTAWKKENGTCKMCYECRGKVNTSTFNATYARYISIEGEICFSLLTL